MITNINWVLCDDQTRKCHGSQLTHWKGYLEGTLTFDLIYEGITDLIDSPIRGRGWALYDQREHSGQHRFTWKADNAQVNVMKGFAEQLILIDSMVKQT